MFALEISMSPAHLLNPTLERGRGLWKWSAVPMTRAERNGMGCDGTGWILIIGQT